MLNTTLFNRGSASDEAHSTNTASRTSRPLSEASNVSLSTTPRNIDPNRSRGILREKAGEQSLLPLEKVFPVQIGSELFQLSGASIISDAPSYFTQFFEEQIRRNKEEVGIKTLYIDRDPIIFRDIARHLQGYYLQPLNGTHYVRLFADAQFYSLPRLISQLFESETFIQIGDRHFQVPKDIFSAPGDTPNFFTLGFGAFFSSPHHIFPGLDRTGLLRPPAAAPPSVPSRSAEVFAQLLHLLRGYPLQIKDEAHRAELLRDCRYFHLKGLEQKLIAHDISYNHDRQCSEILLRLEDVKPSGISLVGGNSNNHHERWVHYARPFADEGTAYELILEIGSDPTVLSLSTHQATFHGSTRPRMSALLQLIAGKVDAIAPVTPLDGSKVRFEIDGLNTDLVLDGKAADAAAVMQDTKQKLAAAAAPESKKRKLGDGIIEPELREWRVRTGQWRLRVRQEVINGGWEIVLVAVKVDAFACERARNAQRRFLHRPPCF